MTGPRTYGDRCGIARALDAVGERWALLVVRELLLGPKRFTDLRTGLPHASPNVLAQRLRELEEAGVVRRRTLAPPAASKVYELTDRGMALEPVVIELGRWGAGTPSPPPGVGMSLDSTILSLRTLFDSGRADGFSATLELRLGDQPFRAEVAEGRLEVVRGEATSPDAIVATDHGTLLALIRGRRSLAEATRTGDVVVEGDDGAVARFMGLFPLPHESAQPA
jgi:DNA-binding HxlR family transcriptional regulator/putative sterol carrier protein